MAEWKQTLEPYIKVQERVMTAALNPTVGEDLIVGVAFISDAGPSTPTLITSQKDFLATYASGEVNKEYLAKLDEMYDSKSSGLSSLASTMWTNAYRLAGSTGLLCVRAAKSDNIFYAKPLDLDGGEDNTFILKDGELLKKMESRNIRLFIDKTEDEAADHNDDGWSINVRGVGRFGNRVTDNGAQYDYFAANLEELIEKLNETSKFFATEYTFEKATDDKKFAPVADPAEADAVHLETVYLASHFLEEDFEEEGDKACWNMDFAEWDSSAENPEQQVITDSINEDTYSGFEESGYFALNTYNSKSNIKIRIRRFNHDAVTSKSIDAQTDLTPNGPSPWTVLPGPIKLFAENQTDYIKSRDFFEIAVLDPGISSNVSFFNIGHIPGRGDIEDISELNDLLNMISLELPDDLHDLDLNYYGFSEDDNSWVESEEVAAPSYIISNESSLDNISEPSINAVAGLIGSIDSGSGEGWYKGSVITSVSAPEASDLSDDEKESAELVPSIPSDSDLVASDAGKIFKILVEGSEDEYKYYKVVVSITKSWVPYNPGEIENSAEVISSMPDGDDAVDGKVIFVGHIAKYFRYEANGRSQIFADLKCSDDILKISDGDLLKAIDKIQENEVYIVEGLCDLGNTNPAFQSYLTNLADSEDGNYFYPISTINSTNYMTIGNSAAKLSKDSYKLYLSAPWDIDTSTLGFRFEASPSVIYWEGVSQNYRAGRPYASLFGQTYGKVNYQRPVCEFNKKQRQLLLSKKVNTVMWNTNSQIWQMNDNYTKQSENTIMNDEGNVRMGIHIAKVQNQLLAQFIGKKITPRLCADVRSIEEYWLNTNIMSLDGNRPEAFQVFCEYDADLARQNKIKVVINIRFSRALKYVNVLNRYFDTGMDISSDI